MENASLKPIHTRDQPLVSIGIPVFNGEKFLQQALDSVLAQDYPCWEIIIYDNASTDKTEEISRTYTEKDGRIRFYQSPENLGAAKNFNSALQQAKGTYFTWLACDDFLSSEKYLSSIINFMESHSDVVLCGSSMRTFYEEDPKSVNDRIYDFIFNDREWTKARANFFVYPQKAELIIYGIFRTAILKQHSLVQKNLAHRDLFAAFIMLPRLCFYGRIVALPDVFRSYRCNLDALSYTISGLALFIHSFKIKLTLLRIACGTPVSWFEKSKLIKVTLSNFSPFKRGVSMRHELKLLRKEVAVLRKACAERLDLINKLSAEVKK